MKLLLDGALAPITTEIGFLRVDCDSAADMFLKWQAPIQEKRGVQFNARTVRGTLPSVLESLLPLTSVERRRTLFVPTKSAWTAYFDNGARGGDPASVVAHMSQLLRCQGVRMACAPNTLETDHGHASGRYGAVVWEIYGPERGEYLNTIRSVFVANDGGRWKFQEFGTPQPFEQLDKYKLPRVTNRFTAEMLSDYLAAMGIHAMEAEFYCAEEGVRLINKIGPVAPKLREFSLQEARGF